MTKLHYALMACGALLTAAQAAAVADPVHFAAAAHVITAVCGSLATYFGLISGSILPSDATAGSPANVVLAAEKALEAPKNPPPASPVGMP